MKRRTVMLLIAAMAAFQCALADWQTSMRGGIVPPSPTSAVYTRHAAGRPDNATGAMRLDIPIYTVRAYGYELPVALSYTGGGIRVNDDPYPCGYGWVLQPGLRITRTVLGRPDEEVPAERFTASPPESYDHGFFRSCVNDGTELYGSRTDTERDIFSLSLPGVGCTFMAVKSGDGYRVIHNSGDMLRFDMSGFPAEISVTDGQGTRYLFSGDDGHSERPDWRTNAVTAWALEEIRLDNGEKIAFSWEKHAHRATTNVILSAYTLKDSFNRNRVPGHRHDGESADGGGGYVLTQPDGTNISGSYSGYLHLSGITFPGGTVTFSYMSPEDPYLVGITVRDGGGNTIKSAAMSYTADERQGRLLESVTHSDEGTYRFGYDPQRFETYEAQDIWGFYNGATGNREQGSLTPRIRFRASTGYDHATWVDIGTADRRVDTLAMQANMLRRVTYPTGGSTEYEYEAHHLFRAAPRDESPDIDHTSRLPLEYGGGLRLRRSVTSDGGIGGTSSPAIVKEYRYEGFGSDKAHCAAFPELETFIDGYTCCEYAATETGAVNASGCQYRMLYFGSASNSLDSHIGETPVWYDRVTEISAEGKTEYTNAVLYAPSWETGASVQPHTLRFHSDLDAVFAGGVVTTARTVYKSTTAGYRPVSRLTYDYGLADLDAEYAALAAMQVRRNIHCARGRYAPDVDFNAEGQVEEVWGGMPDSYTIDTGVYGPTYDYGLYKVSLHTGRLYRERDIEYVTRGGAVDSVTRVIEYGYHRHTPLLRTSGETASEGGVILTTYSYPLWPDGGESDDSNGIFAELRRRNIVSRPYKTTENRGGAVTVNGKRYGIFGSLMRPFADYTVLRGDTVTVSARSYDALGNTDGIELRGGHREAYIWGYGGLYPVFAVSGMNRAALSSLTPGLKISSTVTATAEYGDELRRRLGGNGLLETYEYRPLIGVSAVTDTGGTTIRYSYDTSNRLSGVAVDGHGPVKTYSYELQGLRGNRITARTHRDTGGTVYTDSIYLYDGLGRPVQTVSGLSSSTSPVPVAVQTEYDAMGRERRRWQPSPYSGDGGAMSQKTLRRTATGVYGDESPYTEVEYEPSPLCRSEKTTGAGTAWREAGRSSVTARAVNTATPDGDYGCRRYEVDDAGTLKLSGAYRSGTLRVTDTADEDGIRTLRFTDLQGRTVLDRTIRSGGTTRADTYYVHDGYGDLRYILPPEASAAMRTEGGTWDGSSAEVTDWCYVYRYNNAGEVIGKRFPGGATVEILRDTSGKPVLTQDGNQRQRGEWTLHLSDRFGREAVTAVSRGAMDQDMLRAVTSCDLVAQRLGTGHGYTPLGIGISEITGEEVKPVLGLTGRTRLGGYAVGDRALGTDADLPCVFIPQTVTYYDDYTFLDSVPEAMRGEYMPGIVATATSATGLPTGTRLSVPSDGGQADIISATYYDALGREVLTCEGDLMGGVTRRNSELSYTGQPLTVRESRTGDVADEPLTCRYSYDGDGRPLLVEAATGDGAPVPLRTYTYDAVGRLAAETVGGGAMTVEYAYNVRGWTTAVVSPVFTERLYYQEPTSGNPRWGGDVSCIEWSQRDRASGTVRTSSSYDFRYDGFGRLLEARYAGTSADGMDLDSRDYSCTYSYDLQGNVTALRRRGMIHRSEIGGTEARSYGDVDDVSLTYRGNRLVRAVDAAADPVVEGAADFRDGADEAEEYAYDANGNMTKDLNKGIEGITYDRNNRPSEVRFASGASIRYVYDASGRKLREIRSERVPTLMPLSRNREIVPIEPVVPVESFKADTVDYCGSRIYRGGKLERTFTPGGYIVGDVRYHYVNDHQGNVRCVVRDDGVVVESNQYYPYGALMASQDNVQPRKYDAKEWCPLHGLNLYDSSARWYDPALGRTTTMDPLAEKYPALSPYLWCAANPLRFSDPTGRYLETAWDVANFVMDAVSFADNVKKGDALGAAIDVIGMATDAAAIIMPGVPGGAGSAIKAYRGLGNTAKATKATRHNYRKVLQKATGKSGVGFEAHHTLTQKHRKKFEELGINIDEAGNVVWREKKGHRSKSNEITKEWDNFFEDGSIKKTKKSVFQKRDKIEKRHFGNTTGDNPPN